MVLTDAAVEFDWKDYNPFFGFKGFKKRTDEIVARDETTERDLEDLLDDEGDPILPFSIDEVRAIIPVLPDHWKPFFSFAVSSGLRPGELICLRPNDIDWEQGTVTIKRALTLDINGRPVVGRTKNEYSRRTIRLTQSMNDALLAQKKIHDQFGSKYFFCSPEGCRIDLSNFRERVWKKAVEKARVRSLAKTEGIHGATGWKKVEENARVPYRSFKQARHTFATLAISRGEDLSWIAKVMGHVGTQMVHRHYAKFIENANGTVNGSKLDTLFENNGKHE